MIAHEKDKLDRLTFFSDAVFAIAMTLLVIEVRPPHLDPVTEQSLAQALLDLIPNYIGFVVSFVVIARFWVGHHRVCGMLETTDARVIRNNLALLMTIAFMPFPTAVFSEYAQFRVAIGLYTGWLVLVGLANMATMRAALVGRRLVRSDVAEHEVRQALRAGWIPLTIGTLAFVGGMIRPLLALIVLLIGTPVIGWLFRLRAPSAETDPPAGVPLQPPG